jgi:hypothetical protein
MRSDRDDGEAGSPRQAGARSSSPTGPRFHERDNSGVTEAEQRWRPAAHQGSGDDGDGGSAAPATDDGDEDGVEASERTPAMPAIEGPITGRGATYIDPLACVFAPRGAEVDTSKVP